MDRGGMRLPFRIVGTWGSNQPRRRLTLPIRRCRCRTSGENVPICVACGAVAPPPLCSACRARLHPGGSFVVGAIAGRHALHHSGTGRRLVHQLKYHGVVGAADVLAGLMAPLLPVETSAVVPVPRAIVRRLAHGVDPSVELARRIARIRRVPMVRALSAKLWWPRHAGTEQAVRGAARFRGRPFLKGAVLIDDVATSGATVLGALDALGNPPPGHIASVVVATSPGMIRTSKAPIAAGRPSVGKTARQS